MQNRKPKKIYEVSLGKIWLILVIAAIALTVVFELGVWVGKRKVINTHIKEELQKEKPEDVEAKEASEGDKTELPADPFTKVAGDFANLFQAAGFTPEEANGFADLIANTL